MNRRINGQFDDKNDDYKVEQLVTVSGFVRTWDTVARYLGPTNFRPDGWYVVLLIPRP